MDILEVQWLISIEVADGFVILPYVRGVSDQIKRTLIRVDIKTAFRPTITFGRTFTKTKNRIGDFQVLRTFYTVK